MLADVHSATFCMVNMTRFAIAFVANFGHGKYWCSPLDLLAGIAPATVSALLAHRPLLLKVDESPAEKRSC